MSPEFLAINEKPKEKGCSYVLAEKLDFKFILTTKGITFKPEIP